MQSAANQWQVGGYSGHCILLCGPIPGRLRDPNCKNGKVGEQRRNPSGSTGKIPAGPQTDYNLVEFSINTTEDFKKAVKNTKGLCTNFFRRLLITYNRCQIEAEERLEAFPDHNAFVELL